jgi:AcrR family transcriptional regulator
MTKKRTKRMTAAERREQLVEVGRNLFAKHGYEATTVEEIARKAGVSKPIVYEHFGGKEGLYAVVVDREMKSLLDGVTQSIGTGEPRERFERAALAFLTYVENNPAGFTVLSRDAPIERAAGSLSSVLNELAARVTEIFAAEFRKLGYEPKSAPIYAHALVGMVTYVGQWWRKVRRPPVRDVARHLAALSWMGLSHLPKRPELSIDPEE